MYRMYMLTEVYVVSIIGAMIKDEYTATEARNNFFSLLTALQMGKKKVVIKKDGKVKFEIKLVNEKEKKPSWKDWWGVMDNETAKEMTRAIELTDKAKARGSKQW